MPALFGGPFFGGLFTTARAVRFEPDDLEEPVAVGVDDDEAWAA